MLNHPALTERICEYVHGMFNRRKQAPWLRTVRTTRVAGTEAEVKESMHAGGGGGHTGPQAGLLPPPA